MLRKEISMSQPDVDLISQQQESIVASFASDWGWRLHQHFMPVCSGIYRRD
jgi:hypothetical protein